MTKRKENVTRRPWRDVVFIAVAVALAPAATTVSGCGQCEDTDLCSPYALEIRFVEELSELETYDINVEYDGRATSCSVTLPDGWWTLGTCPPDEYLGAGGQTASQIAAGTAGAGRDLSPHDLTYDCSSRDLGVGFRCGISRIAFRYLQPDSVTVTVHRDGELILSSTVTPEYRTYQPHKKGCGPVCREAVETIKTP